MRILLPCPIQQFVRMHSSVFVSASLPVTEARLVPGLTGKAGICQAENAADSYISEKEETVLRRRASVSNILGGV